MCPKHCWELAEHKTEKTETVLWVKDKQYKLFCEGHWQQINKDAVKAQIRSKDELSLPSSTELWLKLEVLYETEETLLSYFESVDYNNDLDLSVGDYIGGSAGNYWEAPFTNRIFSRNDTTNCRKFYHASDNCESVGTMSYVDQMTADVNATVVRGHSWFSHCRADLNDTAVTSVLFMISANVTARDEIRAFYDGRNITERCDSLENSTGNTTAI